MTPTLPALTTTVEAAAVVVMAVSGMLTAARARMDLIGTFTLALVTAFGGVLRDVLVREIPAIFRPGALHAASSFVGCWVVLAGPHLEIPQSIADAAGFATIVLLRMASVRLGLRLPDPHWMGPGKD